MSRGIDIPSITCPLCFSGMRIQNTPCLDALCCLESLGCYCKVVRCPEPLSVRGGGFDFSGNFEAGGSQLERTLGDDSGGGCLVYLEVTK